LEKYSIEDAFKQLNEFVVNDFSRNYIKITRDREDNKEVVGEVLEKISLLLAPFAPYISEYIYQNFSKNSVHLSEWLKVDKKKIDKNLEGKLKFIFQIIEAGLAERDKAQIGLKWPLKSVKILAHATTEFKKGLDKELKEIVKNQLNVKDLELEWKTVRDVNILSKVELDTNLTPELESEGYARELSRQIQAFRKKLGLVKTDRVSLVIIADRDFNSILRGQEKFLKERTNSGKLDFVTTDIGGKNEESPKHSLSEETFKNKIEFKIKDKRGKIVIVE